MIELVFVACLATAADACAERKLLMLSDTGPTSCMIIAQPQLALWTEAHPGYRVVRWSCRWKGSSDVDA